MSRVQKLVDDPMSESWWTSRLHISVVCGRSMWNFPQDVYIGKPFPSGVDSSSNGFRMHVHGNCSSKDGLISVLKFKVSELHSSLNSKYFVFGVFKN